MICLTVSSLAHALEGATPVFDNRNWKLGWSAAEEAKKHQKPYEQVFDEYVLEGETVNNWSELVTIQFFPITNAQVTLKAFETANKDEMMKTCPNANWRTLYSQKTEVMWEWDIKGCAKAEDQSEIARVVKTKAGIHVFHYAIKKSPMPQEVKKTWEANLKAFNIK